MTCRCRYASKLVMISMIVLLYRKSEVAILIVLIQYSSSLIKHSARNTIVSEDYRRRRKAMSLQRAIRKLEQLQENTEPRGNSASNILRETGNFLQHDLQEVIDLLNDHKNELESKTTPKAATSEVV